MTRLNLLLMVALVVSSVYLVQTTYEGRRVFAALDRAKNEQQQLEIEYQRLEAEREAQATNLRVEKVARERLGMRTATPAVTHYVDDVASGAAR